MVVRFEDLVLQTEETLRAVCEFLGETFEPDMLGMPAAPERRVRLASHVPAPPTATPTATTAVLSAAPAVTTPLALEPPLSAVFVGRFRERVSTADVAFIQLHAGRLMPAFDYLPVPLGWGTGEWARFLTRTWPGQVARLLAWRGREALQRRFPTCAGPAPDPRFVSPTREHVR